MKTTRKPTKSSKANWPRFDAMADAQRHQRIAMLREEEPAAEEIAAIAQGSKEFREGNFIDLSQLRHELGRRRQQPRAKRAGRISRKA